jgi:hypothetical protein
MTVATLWTDSRLHGSLWIFRKRSNPDPHRPPRQPRILPAPACHCSKRTRPEGLRAPNLKRPRRATSSPTSWSLSRPYGA